MSLFTYNHFYPFFGLYSSPNSKFIKYPHLSFNFLVSQNSYVYTITNRPLPSVPRRQQPWLIALVVCTKPKVFTHLLASIQAVDFHCPRALPRPCASKAKPCYLRPLHAVFFHRHPHSSRDTTSSLKPQGLLMSVAGRETGRGTDYKLQSPPGPAHLDQHSSLNPAGQHHGER